MESAEAPEAAGAAEELAEPPQAARLMAMAAAMAALMIFFIGISSLIYNNPLYPARSLSGAVYRFLCSVWFIL